MIPNPLVPHEPLINQLNHDPHALLLTDPALEDETCCLLHHDISVIGRVLPTLTVFFTVALAHT